MISMDKKYRTRDGREVRSYAVDADPEYPIHGAVKSDTGWDMNEWDSDGRYYDSGTESGNDLIEIPREITVNLWINAKSNGDHAVFISLENATICADEYTVKCYPVTVTIPENWKAEK